MTNEEKITYLNTFFNNSKTFRYGGPKRLFKYRPFDKFAFDMLENEYLYLCPAKSEDDETECDVSFDVQDYYDVKTGALNIRCIDQIIEFIRPYSTEENYQKAKALIYGTIGNNELVRPNFMLDAYFTLQELVPEIDVAPVVNWLVKIPEKLDDPQISSQIEKLFSIGATAKEEVGICSLCESPFDDEMWKNYADNETGYCVEYDMADYEFSGGVFPVIYSDERQTNIVIQILGNFIGQMIYGASGGQINADKSQFIRLFLTKNTKWAYQNEWRLLGDANVKMKAPKIKAIYLGKNCTEENRQKILALSLKKRFVVV